MTVLAVTEALAPGHHAVGHARTELVDERRGGRRLPVDIWYPATGASGTTTTYDLFAGVGFSARATEDAPPPPGPQPVVVWSHGRTGTRTSYVLLCEGLAAQGFVVVAADHVGDTLADWLTGAASDDAANETDRVTDIGRLLEAVTDGTLTGGGLELDAGRVAVAGHSYGGWTALASATAHADAVRGVAGFQPFSRTIPRADLAGVTVPVLLVAGSADTTTPPGPDAHRAFEALDATSAHLFEITAAGHQACSDVGLYLEMLPRVDGLPEMVLEMVGAMAEDVTGTAGDPWRPVVSLHLELLVAWLGPLFDGVDPTGSLAPFASHRGMVHRSRPAP